jgi:hypothetical protein
VFDHILVPAEVPIIASNLAMKRMLRRANVWSFEDIRRRAQEAGIKRVGVNDE